MAAESFEPAQLPGKLTPEQADRLAAAIAPSWAQYFEPGFFEPALVAAPVALPSKPAAQPASVPAPGPRRPSAEVRDKDARREPRSQRPSGAPISAKEASLRVPTTSSPWGKIVGALVAVAAIGGGLFYFLRPSPTHVSRERPKPTVTATQEAAPPPAITSEPAPTAAEPAPVPTAEPSAAATAETTAEPTAEPSAVAAPEPAPTPEPVAKAEPVPPPVFQPPPKAPTPAPKSPPKTPPPPKAPPKGKGDGIVRDAPF